MGIHIKEIATYRDKQRKENSENSGLADN